MIEELLNKWNVATHRKQEEPENLLYEFQEHQAQQNFMDHVTLYGAVGYELQER